MIQRYKLQIIVILILFSGIAAMYVEKILLDLYFKKKNDRNLKKNQIQESIGICGKSIKPTNGRKSLNITTYLPADVSVYQS